MPDLQFSCKTGAELTGSIKTHLVPISHKLSSSAADSLSYLRLISASVRQTWHRQTSTICAITKRFAEHAQATLTARNAIQIPANYLQLSEITKN